MKVITNRHIKYLNAEGEGKGGEGKKALAGLGLAAATAAIGAIANRAGNRKTGLAADVKAACGRKPLFGKAKKEAYAKCAADFANKSVSPQGNQDMPITTPVPEKQPMSTGMKIGIGVGVAAIIGVIIYVAVKKRKK